MPYFRLNQPKPAPSVRPATPVVELMPSGVARPWACAAASKSPRVQPGSTVRLASARIHLDALHQRKIDHETAIAHGIARDVVPAASNGDDQIVLAREVDGADHILRRLAAGDQSGSAVDHGVPDLACLVVASVARKQDIATEVRLELVDACRSKFIHSCLLTVSHVQPPDCRKCIADPTGHRSTRADRTPRRPTASRVRENSYVHER